ncbi:MAG TPA: ABC transporter ATP-binding protein [Casimicrobiaceae bacterium]|nr:ABC transporter ATP-binding protein [Casimicrobiaceae bacterium]
MHPESGGSVATPKIRLQHVSKRFASGPAAVPTLHNVDLSIHEGDFVTLIGPSGCGKSTLFNILVGLVPPDEGGALFIDGKQERPDHLLGRVAFMPQRDMLLPWRTVLDNAILAAEIDGVARAEARERARRSLDRFGLNGFEHYYPGQLSGGMRQRVALMRTFMFDREIMLLDEPFGALDALTRALMQRWLLEVWEGARRTVLFITHDIEEAIFLGDRVLVMSARPGHIKLDIPVRLPRPRSPDVVTSPEFVAIKRDLLSAVEDESMKAFAAMNRAVVEQAGG